MQTSVYRPEYPELKEAVDIVAEHGYSKEQSYKKLVGALIQGDLVASRGRAGYYHDVPTSYWYHWREVLRSENEAHLNKTVYFPSGFRVSLEALQEWLLQPEAESTPLVSIGDLREFLREDEIKDLTREEQKNRAKERFGTERITDRKFKSAIPETRRAGRKPKKSE